MEETKEMFKSMFRQKVYEYIYKIEHTRWDTEEIVGSRKLIEDVKVAEYDALPRLRCGTEIFLKDLDMLVCINNVVMCSDGDIVYYIIPKDVDTENSEKTRLECAEKIKEKEKERDKDAEIEALHEELNEMQEKYKKYTEKYKYEHRFFNF